MANCLATLTIADSDMVCLTGEEITLFLFKSQQDCVQAGFSSEGGDKLDNTKLNGEVSLWSSMTRLHHVNQDKPPPTAWTQWRKACQLWSSPEGLLHRPLWRWTHTPGNLRMHWPTYYSKAEDNLYVHTANGFEAFFTQEDGRTITPDPSNICTSPSNDSYPEQAETDGTHWIIKTDQCNHTVIVATVQTPAATWTTYLSTLSEWETQLFQELEILHDVFDLASMFTSGEYFIASDGAASHQSGSFGWIIAHDDGTHLARCAGPALGVKPSSYRVEGYGLFSPLRLLGRLQDFTGMKIQAEFCLFCDNSTLVNIRCYFWGYQRRP